MQIINGIYLFGFGEALPKYNRMTPNLKNELRTSLAGHNVKCETCMCELTIAAFGPNVEDGGSYVRHPYIRAKTQHVAGFPCYDDRPNSDAPINMSTLEEKESLENAMARLRRKLATAEEDDAPEVSANPTSPNRIPSGPGTGTSRTIRNVVRLPLDWRRIRMNKKYSYNGNFKVDVAGMSSGGFRNIYLRSVSHDGNKFNIKLKMGMPLYEIIENDQERYHNSVVTIITAFYMNNGIHESYITYWPEDLNNIQIEIL